MRRSWLAACAVTLTSSLAFAQAPPADPEVGLELSALKVLPARDGARLTVTSPSFTPMGDIPFEFTQYKDNRFPGLEWTSGPAGTRSYAVILQDTDFLLRGAPVLHWTMFNIAGTKLEAGMTDAPAGSTHGPNMRGANQPYMGPRTPAGPKHRYHFQVFALDTMLPASAGESYDALIAAMKGHVLASGEVVGLGQVDPSAPARGGGRGGARGGAPGGAPPAGQ
jgi:para-nitrobenzyl esterase